MTRACLLLAVLLPVVVCGEKTDWRIVAADQSGPSAVMFSGAPDAARAVTWRWDPARDPGIRPSDAEVFSFIDECKVCDFGATLLVNASNGGVAAIDIATTNALWYAKASRGCAGPHSVAVLPDGRVAVANSTGCDALEILDVRQAPLDPARQRRVRAADVPGAHGVVWDAHRGTLFVLGYTNLLEYAYLSDACSVRELRRWKYDALIGDAWGHDLTADARGGYFLTNHSGVWRFDPGKGTFAAVRTDRNVKSFSRDSAKGDLLQIPNEQWWSDRLTVIAPDGARRTVGPFPGARFYKARWFTADARLRITPFTNH